MITPSSHPGSCSGGATKNVFPIRNSCWAVELAVKDVRCKYSFHNQSEAAKWQNMAASKIY